MKVCKRCKEEKSIEKFHRNKSYRDGINYLCKKCDTEQQRIYRETARNWKFPFKKVTEPEYIEAREKLFAEAHGWWCNDGKEWKHEF